MCIEGIVSQIMFIGASFCFIKSGKKHLKNTQKILFHSNQIKNRASVGQYSLRKSVFDTSEKIQNPVYIIKRKVLGLKIIVKKKI